jgi:membrane associated rhomboid family serine protease
LQSFVPLVGMLVIQWLNLYSQRHEGYKVGTEPNQWFRFIIPIFLHAGVIHLLLNMLAQMTLSTQVHLKQTTNELMTDALQIERDMGSIGFTITYFAAGIFG